MKVQKPQMQVRDTVSCSPVRPARVWAQCRCGGHSPRRHFMVWRALLAHYFQLNQLLCKHAGQPVGFPIAVGQGYLVLIKRPAWWINTRAPTFLIPFYHPPDKFSSGKSACGRKGPDMQWCNREQTLDDGYSWSRLGWGWVQTKKESSCLSGDCKKGKKRNTFKHNYCDVALSPNGDVAHHGHPSWQWSQSRLSSLKLNKKSGDYRSGNGSFGEHAAWFEGILNVREEPRMWTWLCVSCLLGQMTKQGWHTLSLVWSFCHIKCLLFEDFN